MIVRLRAGVVAAERGLVGIRWELCCASLVRVLSAPVRRARACRDLEDPAWEGKAPLGANGQPDGLCGLGLGCFGTGPGRASWRIVWFWSFAFLEENKRLVIGIKQHKTYPGIGSF